MLRPEKKSSSRLSGGCAIVITAEKKSSSRDFYTKLIVLNLNVTNYGRTDGQTDGETHSLRVGWRNLPMLCVGWRNLFSSCSVVSVFGSGRKKVLVVHTTMYLEYHTVVVLC